MSLWEFTLTHTPMLQHVRSGPSGSPVSPSAEPLVFTPFSRGSVFRPHAGARPFPLWTFVIVNPNLSFCQALFSNFAKHFSCSCKTPHLALKKTGTRRLKIRLVLPHPSSGFFCGGTLQQLEQQFLVSQRRLGQGLGLVPEAGENHVVVRHQAVGAGDGLPGVKALHMAGGG